MSSCCNLDHNNKLLVVMTSKIGAPVLSWVPAVISTWLFLRFGLWLSLSDIFSRWCRRMPNPLNPIWMIIRVHHSWLRIVSSVPRIRENKPCGEWLPLLKVLLIRARTKFVLDRRIIGGRCPVWQRWRHISSFKISVILGVVHVAEEKRFECRLIQSWKWC